MCSVADGSDCRARGRFGLPSELGPNPGEDHRMRREGSDMKTVIAVCGGNTCRSPLFEAAFKLVAPDTIFIETACAPTKHVDSEYYRVLPHAKRGFKTASDDFIGSGLGDVRTSRLQKEILEQLERKNAGPFDQLVTELHLKKGSGDFVFVAATEEHAELLRKWASKTEWASHKWGTPLAVHVLGIEDSAFFLKQMLQKLSKKQLEDIGIKIMEAKKERIIDSAYHDLASAMILKARKSCSDSSTTRLRSDGAGCRALEPTGRAGIRHHFTSKVEHIRDELHRALLLFCLCSFGDAIHNFVQWCFDNLLEENMLVACDKAS